MSVDVKPHMMNIAYILMVVTIMIVMSVFNNRGYGVNLDGENDYAYIIRIITSTMKVKVLIIVVLLIVTIVFIMTANMMRLRW